MLIRSLVSIAALISGLPALAQAEPAAAPSGQAPQRIRSVTLIGDQKCPPATSPDEVVVCARINPSEQYRIPKELRNDGPVPVQNQSWAAKTDVIDDVSRTAGGLPNTCSPVGSGGHTGCTQKLLDQARADKRAGTTNPPR